MAGTADSDIARQLRDLGIGYLWVHGGSEEDRARIDNTPGLGSASGNPDGVIWQLEPPVSRSTVRDPRGLVNLEAGPASGRVLEPRTDRDRAPRAAAG